MSQKNILNDLCDKYGTEQIKTYIEDYSFKLSVLSNTNENILSCKSVDSKEYNQKVEDVTSATKDYYAFIGHLPDELKKILLSIDEDNPLDSEVLKSVGIILDGDLKFSTNVLFSMQAIRPKLYTMQLDTISNQLSLLSEKRELKVSAKGNRPVITSVTLNMPINMKIEGNTTLSTYDKSVINGVNSLMESGNTAFSIPMLYHAMTGKQNPTVDDQLYDEISEKLENMRRMMLNIDMTEEARAENLLNEEGNPLNIDELSLEGYLLPLNKLTGIVNGKKTVLYQIIQPPPLYIYSKMKRQLATAPISLLNAPLTNNTTTIPLKTYLLQRIEMAKKTAREEGSLTILYETVYYELGAEEQSKTQKMRIRRYTATILDYFIENDYIAGYAEYKEGRSIKGVRVEV